MNVVPKKKCNALKNSRLFNFMYEVRRVPNAIKLLGTGSLKTASGKNPNSFYEVEETPPPVVSEKAIIAPLALKETILYDLPTQAGKTYTILAQ